MALENKVLINAIKALNELEDRGEYNSRVVSVKNREDLEELKSYLANYNVIIQSSEKHDYYSLKISKKEKVA